MKYRSKMFQVKVLFLYYLILLLHFGKLRRGSCVHEYAGAAIVSSHAAMYISPAVAASSAPVRPTVVCTHHCALYKYYYGVKNGKILSITPRFYVTGPPACMIYNQVQPHDKNYIKSSSDSIYIYFIKNIFYPNI